MRNWLVVAQTFVAAWMIGCGSPTPSPDGGARYLHLEVEPGEAVLEASYGQTPSVAFRAYGSYGDGTRIELTPDAWSLSHERIGTLDDTGTFVADGRTGGEVEVRATVEDGVFGELHATATVRVRVTLEVPPDASVPAPALARWQTTPTASDPREAAALLYPLDGARMPNNVGAPVVQWYPREGAGDLYRVELETAFSRVGTFVYDDGRSFLSSWSVPDVAWRAIADGARGAEVTIRVDRLPARGAAIVRGEPARIWLSEDGVFGSLFYWQVAADPQASDILRIDATRSGRTSVFQLEPGRCVGCHALSQDGRTLAATTDARDLAWVTSFVDATPAAGPPEDLLPPLRPAYHFLAWSPDGARVLASRAEGGEATEESRLTLLDGATFEPITTATGLPSGNAGYPAWSPDGAHVAWMDGGGDGTRGTRAATRILVADVLGPDAIGEPRVLHDGESLRSSPEGGATDSRPTFSPDGRFVAFAHGSRSISTIERGVEPPRASLYLAPTAGGPAIRLTRGMGEEGPVDAFWPVFSPFVTEEADGQRLYWLAFYSRQHYGNARAGTRGTTRRQLWVMAIDPSLAEAGEDPSSAPYWLPGQATNAENMSALWAPTACRGRDESCGASSECCSGECAPSASDPDALVCQPPSVCHATGESCEDARDCCAGLECNLGVCGYAPPI